MAPGSRPEIDALTVQVRPNEAIAENDEKNRAEAPSMRRRKMVAPGWGLRPKSAMAHGNLGLYEADQSQQCSRVEFCL